MTSLTLPLVFDLHRVNLTDEQFYQLCINNPEIPLERNPQGALIIMSPVGGSSGSRELELGTDLTVWNRQTNLGKVFSSSTLFKLPSGGERSPDAAWVELSRWQALTPEQRQKFPPIAPDFVMEVRSRTDDLAMLQAKMQEYLDSGVRWSLCLTRKISRWKFIVRDSPRKFDNYPLNFLASRFYRDFC